jgi:hypothetical protein
MKHGIGLIALLTVAAVGSITAASPAKQKEQSTSVKAFTYDNVVTYFKEAHLRATEVQPRCTVLFEGEWRTKDIYNYCLIIVEKSDEDLQVTFYLTDAHEMNWITEFLDGPFFRPDETQKLFGLLNSNRDIRGQNIGRFRVDCSHWQPRHAHILVFSFTPKR